jgi:hypothetical protein
METFVIQIPTQTQTRTLANEEQLRGVVEHVGTGHREAFADVGELAAFLCADHRDSWKEVER